jgi:hypothetical protein
MLRQLHGEPVNAVPQQVAVPTYELKQEQDWILARIDAGLKEREHSPPASFSTTPTGAPANCVVEVETRKK